MKKMLSIICTFFVVVSTMVACTTDHSIMGSGNVINLYELTTTCEGVSISENLIKITEGGEYYVEGQNFSGMIHIDTPEIVDLKFKDVNIYNSNGPVIYVENSDKVYITTENTNNSLFDLGESEYPETNAVIYSKSDLEFRGSGYLSLSSDYNCCIRVEKTLTISDGNISAYRLDGNASASIKAANVVMNGGYLYADGNADKIIEGIESVIVNDGQIEIEAEKEGIFSSGMFEINGGELSVFSGLDHMQIPDYSYESVVQIIFSKVLTNGTDVSIEDDDGREIWHNSLTTSDSDMHMVMFTSNSAMSGEYTIKINGEPYRRFTVDDKITIVDYRENL